MGRYFVTSRVVWHDQYYECYDPYYAPRALPDAPEALPFVREYHRYYSLALSACRALVALREAPLRF